MANTTRVLVDTGDGVLEGQPAADFGAIVLMQSPFTTAGDPVAKTAGERFDAKASIGHTAAPDANYLALVTDTQIGFATLTAPRTVVLPDVDLYPLGQVLFIADESGQCSPDRPILIVVGAGSNDTIAGQGGIQLTDPYQGIGLRRGAANIWIIAR